MPYGRELEIAFAAARDAGEILLRHWRGGSKSWEKSEDNPVTQADLEADRAIVTRLRAAFPDDAILSEETANDPSRTQRTRAWIVDPMDGTKEFIARIPEFAVSIALVEKGDPVAAVIVNPAAQIAVFATRAGGSWRASLEADGDAATLQATARRVNVSSCTHLDQAVLIASRTEISRNQLAAYSSWCRRIEPVGSIAWKLACIACGDADLNVSVAPKNEWDVCAGDLLVREAGGVYCGFDGERRRYNQDDPLIAAGMVAGPTVLVEAFRRREVERRREAAT
jgi:myo-inositol-1(or 4)-monophosphatase